MSEHTITVTERQEEALRANAADAGVGSVDAYLSALVVREETQYLERQRRQGGQELLELLGTLPEDERASAVVEVKEVLARKVGKGEGGRTGPRPSRNPGTTA